MDLGTLNSALIAQFSLQENTDNCLAPVDKDTLLKNLRILQHQHIDSFSVRRELSNLLRQQPLEDKHHAVIAFLDSCCSEVVKMSGFPEEVSSQLMQVVICLIQAAIDEGILAITKDHVLVGILEGLIEMVTGWSDLQGKQKQEPERKLQLLIASLSYLTEMPRDEQSSVCPRAYLMSLIAADIAAFTKNDRKGIGKLEQRLIDSEEGQLKASRSRKLAAQMINSKMEHKILPEPMVKFLQGAWFDSVQLLLTRDGLGSEAWLKASKLTETLILTLQPENIAKTGTSKDLYRIIEHLPEELRESLVSLQHNSVAADAELAAIESEHVALLSGQQPVLFDFDNLEVDEGLLDDNISVSQTLLSRVEKLSTGQWFAYVASNQPLRHIKLTMKLEEMKQLLFTNRNGVKVLQLSFDEFAYMLGSATAAALPSAGSISNLIRHRLKRLIKRHLMRGRETKQGSKSKLFSLPGDDSERGRCTVNTAVENSADLEEAKNLVSKLKPGARFSLGAVEARLIVDAPAEDRMILVDRVGADLGEYTRLQMTELILDDRCVVLDCGGGFDDFRERINQIRTRQALSAGVHEDDNR